MTESTPRTDSFGMATTKGTQYSHCTQMQPHSHSLSHVDAHALTRLHDARTFVVHSHVCVCGCAGVWVCERVAATLSIPCAGARVETYWIPIRYQYSRPWTHTSTCMACIHIHIYRVCERVRELRGERVQARDYPMCGKIRFRCRSTAQAANRKAAASWLDKFEWPKWPKWTAAARERKCKRYRWKKRTTTTTTTRKPKACPEVSRMDRCKLLENVKNYIICAEKCAYIFCFLFLSGPSPSPSFATDHLLSSFETSRVGVFFMQNFCVLQFIAYSICLGRQGHPTTTTATMQTNSKGPEHINKDFISFIRFVSFRFILCFTTHTHTHLHTLMGRYFLFFYTHTPTYCVYICSIPGSNKWLNV